MKTRTLLHFTTIALGAFLLAIPHDARAQHWASPTNVAAWDLNNDGTFDDQALSWGETMGGSWRMVGQTFTAPATNPELRQIWALGSIANVGDAVDIHIAPWDDDTMRVTSAPVFNSGAKWFALTTNPKTMTLRLPSPLMLTPGARYILIVRTPVAPGGTIERVTLGRTNTNPFPDGDAFHVTSVPPGTPLDITTYDWDFNYNAGIVADFGLQPAFTQAGPVASVLLYGAKDGTGTPVADSPGTTFASFGIPSRNTAGIHAFVANVRDPDGRITQALCTNEVIEGVVSTVPRILARKGDALPGLSGVTFAGFKDPLLVEDGRLVVLATLAGTGVDSTNKTGLFSYVPGGAWTLHARTGDEPPGVLGARIKSFRSVAACDGGIAWLYQMVSGPSGTAGPGGVTTATDMALAVSNSDFTVLGTPLIREGSNFGWDLDNDGIVDDSGIVKSFSALTARTGAAGHGHGIILNDNTGEEVVASSAFQAKFTDGRVGNFSTGQDGRIDSVVTGDVLTTSNGFTVEIAGHGIIGQSSGGANAAVARFKSGTGGVDGTNDAGIIGGAIGEGASDSLALLAQKGTAPLGGGGAAFYSFMSPVLRHLGDTGTHEVGQWIGFMAKLKGPGISSTNDLCVSRMVGSQFAAVAREGGEAPGVPGSQFRSFTSHGFMDYTDDACMNALMVLARMRTGADGAPGPGGVTTAIDEGLWLFDHHGDGHLAFREGGIHIIGGVPKTVKKFIVLPSVSGSPAQKRSHNAAGEIILRAIFTDGTCALVKLTK